jgi:hypothetical protein
MNSFEKVQNMLNLVPPKDRREIPVYPMILTFAATASGMTQKEIIDSPKNWLKAMDKTFEIVGTPDVSQGNYPGDVIFLMGLEFRRPGYELGVNECYQFIEKPQFEQGDYKKMLEMGWLNWYNKYLSRIQVPPIKSNFGIIYRWIKVGINGGTVAKHMAKKGVAPIHGTGMGPIFDTLSMVRSFEEFIYDLYEMPDIIKEVVMKGTQEATELAMTNAKRAKLPRISLYAMRSDARVISPDIFKEFSFPALKYMVENFHKNGIQTVLHADSNWLPMLPSFLELPKGSVHFELDGETDIFKAYDIIGGWHSMRGDVGANMLVFGTPDDVSQYCDKLITTIGMKGGFMLGSGCEVPLNAKPENVKAMIDAVR